jgi:geranylgeranyl diphosphate synthase type I
MTANNLGEEAKKTLIDFVKLCDGRLAKYWEEELANNFGYNQTQKDLVRKMLLHASEHNLRPAKRLRASFVYYGYLLGQGCEFHVSGVGSLDSARDDEASRNDTVRNDNEDIWKAAEAVELVHTALLMHDDFTDMDVVRRGKPTTQIFFADGNKHYGDSMAIYVGDTVLCLGFERLLDCGFEDKMIRQVMKKMLRGITNTALGQSYDVSLPKLGELTEEKVMSLHRAKTAIYTYENPLFVGGILGNIPEAAFEILREYSVRGGIAFQLQDDILGVYGDEEKTGKSVNSDILQGKVTLLAVKVMELGSDKQKEAFMKVWGKMDSSEMDIEVAKKAIRESGSYQYSVEIAKKMAQEAADSIHKLRSLGLNTKAIDYIEGIALYMVNREV